MQDADCEDVDSLFFDVDNDRDLDLYVVSGGNEYFGSDPRLNDRLYLNNGHTGGRPGQFTKSAGLPALSENKSCVRAADVDHDGDLDLFVGGRVNARLYGATPTSVLLRNNGEKGPGGPTFSPEPMVLGLITDARFTDPDCDGWPDLLVVGEWMTPTLLRNKNGQLARTPNDLLTGLWMSLTPLPNGDFVAGNWGLNSKLRASPTYPLRYYMADPDQNGEPDGLLAIVQHGTYYPFLGKDKLEQRLPYLKKKHLTYRASGCSLDDLFGNVLANTRVLNAQTLASGTLHWTGDRYVFTPLPAEAQTGPLLCGLTLPGNRLLIGSGFRGTQPYEGPCDALLPTVFQLGKQTTVVYRLSISGEVRDLKQIGPDRVLLLRNNASAQIMSIKGRVLLKG